MIFAIFSRKNGSKKQEDFWKAKKSHFEASRANCGRSAAVCAGPGEGIKGWGKALGADILGFAFEAGLRGRHNRKNCYKCSARTALPSGGGGCAAHVPPRCTVGMKSRK